jgi:hypothetical protein
MSKSDHNKTIRAQMYVRRMTLFAVGLLLALLVVAFVLLRRPGGMFSSRLQEGLLPLPDSSERAFHESYLGAVEVDLAQPPLGIKPANLGRSSFVAGKVRRLPFGSRSVNPPQAKLG